MWRSDRRVPRCRSEGESDLAQRRSALLPVLPCREHRGVPQMVDERGTQQFEMWPQSTSGWIVEDSAVIWRAVRVADRDGFGEILGQPRDLGPHAHQPVISALDPVVVDGCDCEFGEPFNCVARALAAGLISEVGSEPAE